MNEKNGNNNANEIKNYDDLNFYFNEINKIFNSDFLDKNIIEKKYEEYLQKVYEKTLEIEKKK